MRDLRALATNAALHKIGYVSEYMRPKVFLGYFKVRDVAAAVASYKCRIVQLHNVLWQFVVRRDDDFIMIFYSTVVKWLTIAEFNDVAVR